MPIDGHDPNVNFGFAHSNAKRFRARTPKIPLSPALAHELDIARAARMGIDISYMQPGERCKYPSEFCCHVRARKSTGKLHRFCEAHRSQANIIQKRWNAMRQRQSECNRDENLVDCGSSDSTELKMKKKLGSF